MITTQTYDQPFETTMVVLKPKTELFANAPFVPDAQMSLWEGNNRRETATLSG